MSHEDNKWDDKKNSNNKNNYTNKCHVCEELTHRSFGIQMTVVTVLVLRRMTVQLLILRIVVKTHNPHSKYQLVLVLYTTHYKDRNVKSKNKRGLYSEYWVQPKTPSEVLLRANYRRLFVHAQYCKHREPLSDMMCFANP